MFQKLSRALCILGFLGFQPATASEVVFINPGFNDQGSRARLDHVAKDLGISLEVIPSTKIVQNFYQTCKL